VSNATFAIHSKFEQNPGRIHYSHLEESVALAEVDRLNAHCKDRGLPAIYWCEQHHPDCVFVIG